MSQGYDQFFKTVRSQKTRGKSAPPPRVMRKDRVRPFPIHSLVALVGLLLISGWYFYSPQVFHNFLSRIEVSVFGSSMAKSEAETSPTKANAKAESAQTGSGAEEDSRIEGDGFSEENLKYFTKLNERKRELDSREKQLNELEEELHKQREEVEARIRKLEEMRDQIAVVLKDRVQIDDEKVTKLVEIFSNMKPQQAAKILGEVDENLAVEAVGRMKKKNAAEVLNLLPPEKARILSEKFAGYKRK